MDIKKLLSDNMPLILSSAAVAGVITTTVLAVRATPQALRDISEAQSETTQELTVADRIRLTWRYYTPAAVVGTATIAAIVGSQGINAKRQAALVGLWTVTDKALTEYKSQVIKTLGEKKAKDVDTAVVQERLATDEFNKEIIVTPKGQVRIKDTISGRYFQSDVETIRAAQNTINAECINNVYASLNDFYREIGLPPTGHGEELGWRSDHLLDITFVPCLAEDGEPCIGLDYRMAPIRGYWRGY